MNLYNLGKKWNCGKTYQGYLYKYDELFKDIRKDVTKFLEIGVRFGDSMNMWKDYFPNAEIYGIDIHDCTKFDKFRLREDRERINLHIGDQGKREEMQEFIEKYGSEFDIIIDDGGHDVDLQQISLGFFFKHLKDGGIYSIEDLDTSNKWRYGNFKVREDCANTTYRMLCNFIEKDKIWRSYYFNKEETRYLKKYVDYIDIYHHRADVKRYPFLAERGERNFALGILKKKW